MGQVKKDSLVNTLITYSGIGLGYLNKGILFPLLLLPEQVGLLNVILLLVSFFGQLSNVGTGMIILRFFPYLKDRNKGYSGILLFVLAILFIGILIVVSLITIFQVPIKDYFYDQAPLFVDYFNWIIPLGISFALYILFEYYLRALSRNIFSILIQDFVLRFFVLILLTIFYFDSIRFDQFILLFFILHFIPALFLIFYTIGIGEFHIARKYYRISKRLKKYITNYGLYVYFNSLGRNVILMADAIMVTSIGGLKAAGIFTTMVFLSNALFVPYVSVLRVSVAHVSRFWKARRYEELILLYQRITGIGFFITVLLFSIVWFVFDIIIQYLPDDYASGKYIFLFLMLGRIFDSIGGLNGEILMTSKKYRLELWITIPLIFIVFLSNAWLIPIYGGVGAALSTSFVFFAYNLIRIIIIWKIFNFTPINRKFILLSLNAIAMFVICFITINLIDNVIFTFCFGVFAPLLLFALPVYLFNLVPDYNVILKEFLTKRLKVDTKN